MAEFTWNPVYVLQQFYDELHKVLTVSPITLESLAIKYYQVHFIHLELKAIINNSEGHISARILLDHLILIVEQSFEYLQMIINIMYSELHTQEIARKMDAAWEEMRSNHNSGQSVPITIDSPSFPMRAISNITTVAEDAEKLKNLFVTLTLVVKDAANAMKINVENLKLMVSHYYNGRKVSPKIHAILNDMESVTTTDGLIRFMLNNNLIGYLTMEIFKFVFKHVISHDIKADYAIDNYEQERKKFISSTPLKAFANLFKLFPHLCPATASDDLDTIKFVLSEPWESQSLYHWDEVMKKVDIMPDHLMIVDIENNCIIISYSILPFFIPTILKQLADERVVKALANVGVTFTVDEDLMKIGIAEMEYISLTVEHATRSYINQSQTTQQSTTLSPIAGQANHNNVKPISQPYTSTIDGGFNDEIFLSPPSEELRCVICFSTVKEPHLITCCGTIICKSCMIHTNAKADCPHCRDKVHQLLPDMRTKRQTMSLKVKCTNAGQEECNWTGELVDYIEHTTKKCPNRIVQCQYKCGQYYTVSDIAVHEEEECTKRPYDVLVMNYEKKINQMKKEHYNELQSLKNTNDSQVNILKTEYEQKLQSIEEKFKSQISAINNEFSKKITAIMTVGELEESRMRNEISTLEKEALTTTESLLAIDRAGSLCSFSSFLKKTVPVSPMLLTITGLPNCGKTKITETALKLIPHSSNENCKMSKRYFSNFSIVTGSEKELLKSKQTDDESESIKLALLSGCLYNKEMPIVSDLQQQMPKEVHQFLKTCFKYVNERKEQLSFMKNKHTEFEETLFHGISLINIWDIPLSGCIRPVLESFSKLLTKNFMLLFASLDRDAFQLHLPPEDDNTLDGKANPLLWRSRIEHLLRASKMATQPSDTSEKDKCVREKVCKVFASYTLPLKYAEEKKNGRSKVLQREINYAASQMGMETLIDCNVSCVGFVSEEDKKIDKENERVVKNSVNHFIDQVKPRNIPMSWILLRSFLFSHCVKFYITYTELEKIACHFEIDKHDLERFCDFFSSYGSIFDVTKIDENSNYLIINLKLFLSKLFETYRSHAYGNGINNGIVSPADEETLVLFKILASVDLAFTFSSFPMYYMPSIRSGKCNTICSNKAVRLVVPLSTSRVNISIALPKKLVDIADTYKEDLKLDTNTPWPNIVILKSAKLNCEVYFIFQGDITEIEFVKNEPSQWLVKKILEACRDAIFYQNKSLSLPNAPSSYFVIRCTNDKAPSNVSLRMHRLEHTLPLQKNFCSACEKTKWSLAELWNNELKQFTETGVFLRNDPDQDLSPNAVALIANTLSPCSDDALQIFAEELGLDIKDFMQYKRENAWLIMKILLEWRIQYLKEKRFPRRSLARKLMSAKEKWSIHEGIAPKPKFKRLARSLDFTIMTRTNRYTLAKRFLSPSQDSKSFFYEEAIEGVISVEHEATRHTYNVSKDWKVNGLKDEVLKWEEMGITIHTPAGVVPPTTDYCTITVTSVSHKDCIFQLGVPVSEVFDIMLSCETTKSIQIELQHSVILSNTEELEMLTFTTAPYVSCCSDKSHFTECDGGKFNVGSQYGILKIKNSLKIAIILINKKDFHGISPPSISCFVQLLYSHSDKVVHTVFTQDIMYYKKAAISNFNATVQKIYNTKFIFSANSIEVKTNNISDDKNWSIEPLSSSVITKKAVINFDGTETDIPDLEFCFNPINSECIWNKHFIGKHKFILYGTADDPQCLLLDCGIQLITVELLIHELKDLTHWKEFASFLPMIDKHDMEEISGDVENQKHTLYSKWLKKHPDASWNDVIQTLELVDENKLAKKLEDNYAA